MTLGAIGFAVNGTAAVLLLLALLFAILLMPLCALMDMFSKPKAAWQAAGQQRALWAVLVIIPAFGAGLIFSLIYLIVIRRKVKRVKWAPPDQSATAPATLPSSSLLPGWYSDSESGLPHAVRYWNGWAWAQTRWWTGRRWNPVGTRTARYYRWQVAHPLMASLLLSMSVVAGMTIGYTIVALTGDMPHHLYQRELIGAALGWGVLLPLTIPLRVRQLRKTPRLPPAPPPFPACRGSNATDNSPAFRVGAGRHCLLC